MPTVTVIVPVYNAAKYVRRSIESVLDQTYKDFELIILDDGSSDDSVEIIKGFAGDSRVQVFSREHRGISATLNELVSRANGQYLAYLSADDWWEPNKLEMEVQALEEGVGVIYDDFSLAFPDGTTRIARLPDYDKNLIRSYCFLSIGASLIDMRFLNALFKRDGYYFDDLYSAHDWDLWIRLSSLTRYKHLPVALSYWRMHGDQNSRQLKSVLASIKVYEKHFGFSPSFRRRAIMSYLKQRAVTTIRSFRKKPAIG